ncbi:polar amino acid transport system permease protein [Desulfobaculum xiamenense]|uniref:Putative glutamine transport system permease protein GlnP n=1 Tax=Desulfobaculum xiamenense TaxID=995050 RepID=A0A846QML5_9BACT|nr:amino acid ABC transporter permease [Desulfobaculum xiamenense]NJB68427.1 polar amino acid transport system permease protein [Desulfobaculum xiamenense]
MTTVASPQSGHVRRVFDMARLVALGALALWLLALGERGLGYQWQWYRVPQYLVDTRGGTLSAGPLLEGLVVTFGITAASLVLSMTFGLCAALLRLSDSFVARLAARGYVELIRNTPLLIQLFFIYFVIAPVMDISATTSAIIALSLFEGAYASEIIRTGIESVPRGQWEAAHSLGLSPFATHARVILPQALRRILPPLTGVAVSLVKDSALASTIAVYELTQQGQIIIADTFLTFEIWFTVAAVYLAATGSLSWAASAMERRLATGD